MDFKTRRPNHIEDYIYSLHSGSWFGWSDSRNKIYANLIIHPKIWNSSYEGNIHEEGMMDNPYSLPTEQECIDGLAQLQADFDAQEYARKRQAEYPTIEECVHAILDDDLENLQILRQAVKEKYPK